MTYRRFKTMRQKTGKSSLQALQGTLKDCLVHCNAYSNKTFCKTNFSSSSSKVGSLWTTITRFHNSTACTITCNLIHKCSKTKVITRNKSTKSIHSRLLWTNITSHRCSIRCSLAWPSLLSLKKAWPRIIRVRHHSSRRNRRQQIATQSRFQISNRKTKGNQGVPRARQTSLRSKKQSRVTVISESKLKVSPFTNDIDKEHREREGS